MILHAGADGRSLLSFRLSGELTVKRASCEPLKRRFIDNVLILIVLTLGFPKARNLAMF